MTRLASPLWLGLLAIVVLRLVLLLVDRRRRFGAFEFSSLSLVSPSRGLRVRTAGIPFALELLAFVLLVVALARPQRVERQAASERFGIDIVIALDASGSMAAEDFRPRNRFEVAKELIGDFIRRRHDDRIGIVTFGSRAATRVPVTHDRRIAEALLERAELGEHGNGTAVGHALATSVNRLRNSKARSRVVILVTDGVNNSGSIDPAVAARIAAAEKVRVYTIGVGSEGAVPLPVKRQNPFTGEIETVYRQVRGELDERTLEAIAETTGGEYFRAGDAATMGEVLARIDRLEKSRLSGPRHEQVHELYHWPLAAALIVFALALLAGETVWMKVPA